MIGIYTAAGVLIGLAFVTFGARRRPTLNSGWMREPP
jgi:hypothetical protein